MDNFMLLVQGRHHCVPAWRCYGVNDGKIFVRFISDEELEYTQDGVWRVLKPTELGLRWNSPMLDLHRNGEAAASQALVDAFSTIICAYYSNKNVMDKAID